MSTISLTGIGAIIAVIEAVLRLLGVELPEGSVASAVNGALTAVSVVLLVYGQLRRKDLKLGMIRR